MTPRANSVPNTHLSDDTISLVIYKQAPMLWMCQGLDVPGQCLCGENRHINKGQNPTRLCGIGILTIHNRTNVTSPRNRRQSKPLQTESFEKSFFHKNYKVKLLSDKHRRPTVSQNLLPWSNPVQHQYQAFRPAVLTFLKVQSFGWFPCHNLMEHVGFLAFETKRNHRTLILPDNSKLTAVQGISLSICTFGVIFVSFAIK